MVSAVAVWCAGWTRASSLAVAVALASVATGLVATPVAALTPQAIDFSLPATGYAANLVHLVATSTSGLPVTFASETKAVCTVEAGVGLLLSPGTCTIRASQSGDWAHAPAPEVSQSLEVLEPRPGPQPQTITFTLPATGYVGATVSLEGYSNSPLEIAYSSLTPSVCLTDGKLLALDAAGTCTVRASQAGNVEWQPAAVVSTSMESRAAPFGIGVTALGRHAFNGPVSSVELDPVTGDTWVAGGFTEVGVRTGSIARVNGPGTGSDALDATSPDVIASQVYLVSDDASHYFISGLVGSVNGDGILRSWLTRMNADGTPDAAWRMTTGCSTLPNWAKGQPRFDLGTDVGAPTGMSATASGDSSVGLTLISKSTGVARRAGAGNSACGGRTWPSIAPLPVLASCASWNTCLGWVLDAYLDPASHTLLTVVNVVRRQGATGDANDRVWLVAYDTQAGTRRWAIPIEGTEPAGADWQSGVSRMGVAGGAVVIGGYLHLDPVSTQLDAMTTLALLDLATGTVLQRWNSQGEQDLSDPQGDPVAPATGCLPMASEAEVFRLASPAAGHLTGYGRPTGDTYPVCDYTVTGNGLGSRLSATILGTLLAGPHPSYIRQLPDTIVAGRYLAGTVDAFDLLDKVQLPSWHPSPSSDLASIVPLGSDVILGGEFTFLHGQAAHYVARLGTDLAPVDSFTSGLAAPPSGTRIWGMRRIGDHLLVYGSGLETGAGHTDIAALDAASGAVSWTSAPTLHTTTTVGIAPVGDAFYAGGSDAAGHPGLRRFVRNGGGYDIDETFAPTLTGVNGGRPATIFGLGVINGGLYVGGTFSTIGGVARQGLARYAADGTLDAWAPRLITEMALPAGSVAALQPRVFLEIGGRVVVAGSFQSMPEGGGAMTADSPVLVYDATTGVRVRPAPGAGSWFGATFDVATDATVLGSTLYVALGDTGIAAFDTQTFAYQPYRSIRSFGGWGNNAIYALLVRPGTVQLAARGMIATAAGEVAGVVADPSLVIGGVLPRWTTRSAGNIVALGAGALNTDHIAPVVTSARARPRTSTTLASGLPFVVAWTGSDAGGAGIARYEVGQSRNAGAWTVLSVGATSPRLSVTLAAGSTYRFRVRGVDRAGNIGAWSYTTTAKASLVQQTSASLRWAGTWRTASAIAYSGGSTRYATASGARASFTFTGRAIALVTTAGPSRGKARIYVDGALVATVDLRATTSRYRFVAWYRAWTSSATHTVRVVVLGTRGRPRVDVDGFVVWK